MYAIRSYYAGKPVASLTKARDLLRAAKGAEGGVVEMTGTFALPMAGFSLGEADSGPSPDKPVVYRASKAGARVIGGVMLPADGFSKVTDAAALERLPEAARGRVVSYNFV